MEGEFTWGGYIEPILAWKIRCIIFSFPITSDNKCLQLENFDKLVSKSIEVDFKFTLFDQVETYSE